MGLLRDRDSVIRAKQKKTQDFLSHRKKNHPVSRIKETNTKSFLFSSQSNEAADMRW